MDMGRCKVPAEKAGGKLCSANRQFADFASKVVEQFVRPCSQGSKRFLGMIGLRMGDLFCEEFLLNLRGA